MDKVEESPDVKHSPHSPHSPGYQSSSIILSANPAHHEKKLKERFGSVHRFGWRWITPNFLQCFNNALFLLFCLTMLLTIQATLIVGLFPASVTHIERRFHMTSTEMGGVFSMYDIGFMLALFPICHYGSHGHKGRWIGAAAVCTCLASVICTLPHFLAEDYQYGSGDVDLYCTEGNANTTSTAVDCDKITRKGSGMKVFFFIAQFLLGVASAPMSSIAVAYLDENVSQRASSTYISVYSASNLLGPCLGYAAAAYLSTIYGHVTVDTRTLPMKDHTDPRWYGAWWIGVLGLGLVSGFMAIPIFAFGRELPGKAEMRAKDVDEAHRGNLSVQVSLSHVGWAGLKHQLKLLVFNPTYVSLIIEQSLTIFIVGGLASFATKYLETQFSLNTKQAAIAAAITGILPALVGTAVGTVLQRRMALKCKGNIVLGIIGTVMGTVCWLCFFITCPTRRFAGYTSFESGNGSSGVIETDLMESCNEKCACPMSRFEPYCWTTENISFFSKCHAGCDGIHLNSSTLCSCTGFGHEMKKDQCDSECGPSSWMSFLVGFAVMVLFSSLKKNPVEQATLRCVPFNLRTFALALGGIPKKLFGSIPASPIMGEIMNSNCVVWQEKCGRKEVCVLYDNNRLASHLQLVGTIGFALASVSLFVALIRYRAPAVKEKSQEKSDHSLVEEVLRSSWRDGAVVEP